MLRNKNTVIRKAEDTYKTEFAADEFVIAIEACLVGNGLDLSIIKTEETDAVTYRFHTADHITAVVRLYKYFGDQQTYILIEAASGCVDRNNGSIVESFVTLKNSKMPTPVRITINEDENLLITQLWSSTRYLNSTVLADLLELVVSTATYIKDELIKNLIGGFCGLPNDWFSQKQENLH